MMKINGFLFFVMFPGLVMAANPKASAEIPPGIIVAINTVAAPILEDIDTKQAAYFSAHGKYWQGLITHTAIPEDNESVAPDNLDANPTDQAESWNDLEISLPAGLPFAIHVDVYESPGGWGYTKNLILIWESVLERKTVNVGPETWRDKDF